MSEELKVLQKQLFAKKLEVNSLLEITQAINTNRAASELYLIYEFMLRAQLQLKGLCLMIRPAKEMDWEVACAYGIDGDVDLESIELIKEVGEISNASDYDNSFVKQFEKLIPVFHDKDPIAFALIGESKRGELPEEDLKFVQTLTNVIAVAIENKHLFKQQLEQERIKREMELAGDIQKMLIPNVLPSFESISMSSEYQPHSQVGGDYFDVFDINDDEFVVCVGDISGKGISAAMLMSNFQANLRALVYQEQNLDELIIRLNERFTKITNSERFITFFIAKINKKTHQINYISCGHNPTFIVKNDKVEELTTGCTLLGMFDELPSVQIGESKLEKGDLLFMYTDGIIDVVNNDEEHYEEERLGSFLIGNKSLDSKEFSSKLFAELDAFREGNAFPDDIAFLVVKCK